VTVKIAHRSRSLSAESFVRIAQDTLVARSVRGGELFALLSAKRVAVLALDAARCHCWPQLTATRRTPHHLKVS
uniref:Uncharacterized protein n=1 Tax=Parascaris equorum TaxID=6256 RepID=A0A914RL38_PAREQ